MNKFVAMQAFVKVVEYGSFAEAARQLGQSRSQVNRLVINLEDHLSVTLLNRTTRSVTVTPMGQAYYERCKALLDELIETENFIQSNQDQAIGEIKLNAPMSFGTLHLSSAIVDFMHQYPDICIHMVLSDEKVDPVSSGFDLSVRISQPSENLNLIEHQVVEIKQVICASPDFLAKHPMLTSAKDLKKLPCLHYGNLPSGNYWKLNSEKGQESILVKGVLCSNNGEVLRDAAVAGLGITSLPTFIVGPELKNGSLVALLPQYSRPSIFLNIIYPPNRHLSSRIRLFIKFIQARYGDKPYWD